MGTELVGDRLSRGTNQLGTNCGGPNVRGPHAFGTKCASNCPNEHIYNSHYGNGVPAMFISGMYPRATGATAVAPKFSDTLTLFQPGGGRFCPPLARSHLNLPCGYVPDTYVLVQIHKSYYILSTYILQPTYLHVGKSNNEKAQQMSFLSNTVQSTPILHMCI